MAHFRLHGESNCTDFTALDNGHNSLSAGSTSSSASASARTARPVNQTVLKINSMFQRQINSSAASESASTSRQHAVNKEFPNYPKSTQANCDQNECMPKCKHNKKRNNNMSEHNNNKMLLADSCSISDDAEIAMNNIRTAFSSSARDR